MQRDLFDLLGQHAWELLLESREGESIQWAAVFETTDARRIEATLLELTEWLAGHARVQSFGLARFRLQQLEHGGRRVHATRIRTLLGELPGPAFAAADRHVVVGVGDRAVRTALDLVSEGDFGATQKHGSGPPAHAFFVIHGPALARTLNMLVGADSEPMAAVIELFSRIGEAAVHVSYEPDGLRVHSEVVLGP